MPDNSTDASTGAELINLETIEATVKGKEGFGHTGKI